jgi:hypothetical protein
MFEGSIMKKSLLALVVSTIFIVSCGGGNAGSETPVPPPAPRDTVAPTLTLLGEANVSIDVGDGYLDAGAVATDDIDGDITANIVLSGSVDSDTPGEYRLTYTVSDKAKNTAELVQRLVVVLPDPILQVNIQTNGVGIVDEPKILATMSITDHGESVYQGNIGIEIRGSSSQQFDKKSYGFETWDSDGNDLKVALAGFAEEEDWILYGPYSDKSLVRNVLIYDLANQLDRYAVKTKFSELSINGDYRGLYVLMEKIKRDKNRVNVSKLKSDDISGGYIIKIDKVTGENQDIEFSFASAFDGFGDPKGSQKIQFLYEYPDPEDIEEEQKNYIQTYYRDFEQALMSADFSDPDHGYRKYIDVPSFIDFFLLNELSNNVDAYRISTFMHKEKGEKLKMGPIWDFNIAFGNADYCRGETTDNWAYRFNAHCPDDPSRVPFWWGRLLQDEYFVTALKNRWTVLRSAALSASNIDATLQKHAKRLKHAAVVDKNFGRFNILGTYVWPNFFIGDSYEEEIDYLQQWIARRTTWMDSAIAQL